MSYKRLLHPQVSNAEMRLFEEFSKRGWTEGMTTQQTIVLKMCRPDFMWKLKRKALFLDGDIVHEKQVEKDEEIDELLEAKDWDVKRIRYHAPLSEKRFREILSEVEEWLQK